MHEHETERDAVRAQAVQPGSRQEHEALALLDEKRERERATYEGRRATCWSARAGRPSRSSLHVGLEDVL